MEENRYDEAGNPVTSTLTAHLMPSAGDLETFERVNTEPNRPEPAGAKGITESRSSGSTPVVKNAVVDALSHLGVPHGDLPHPRARVWTSLRDARRRLLAAEGVHR